jgi:hypothetical protein
VTDGLAEGREFLEVLYYVIHIQLVRQPAALLVDFVLLENGVVTEHGATEQTNGERKVRHVTSKKSFSPSAEMIG